MSLKSWLTQTNYDYVQENGLSLFMCIKKIARALNNCL